MKKAVVTGANGFLGNAMVQRLSEMNVLTYAVIKDDGKEFCLPNVNNIYCNTNNIAQLNELISDRDIDCLFYFSWAGSAGSVRGDCAQQLKNAENTCDTVRAASEIGCKKFIFAASIMEYECFNCFNKGVIPGMSNMYSVGKAAAHAMGEILANSLGIDFYPIVISNVYGEGEISPRLINSTIKKLLKGEKTEFTAGLQMYDFIYIKDAIEAMIAIEEKGNPFKEYYLGSLHPHQLKDYLEEIGECFGIQNEMGIGKIDFNGMSIDYYKTFDINAVKNDTGFIPEYTFRQGIENTVEWLREQEI